MMTLFITFFSLLTPNGKILFSIGKFNFTLGAILDGVENNIEPPVPTVKNIYEMNATERKEAGIESLPDSLANAVKLLKEDEVVKNSLGEHIVNEFVTAKEIEWDKYRTYVTQWELDSYLNAY